MPAKHPARSFLRSATAPWHDRVDRIFSKADLTNRTGYGRFLLAQAEAHLSVEDALTRAGAASVLPDWPERQRAALLRADLTALGLQAPALIEINAIDGAAAILGGVYVLEGSRLGGRMLRRSVPPDFPCSFLGAGTPAAWQQLVALLDKKLETQAEREQAAGTAVEIFGQFERSGQRFLEMN